MNFVTQAGDRLLNRVGDGTAKILQGLSFIITYKAVQIIINNIITNAQGFAAAGVGAVEYAPYDASWLLGQPDNSLLLRGEFFIIAFMNSAFQFLLSALIGYELGKSNGVWCKAFVEKDRANKDVNFYFGPVTTLLFYLVPQSFTKKSRHVHGNVNKSLLMYLGLWIILAMIDIWSTTMFRSAVPKSEIFPNGFNPSLIPLSIGMSILYNIVLAEFALLMSGGIAIRTVLDVLEFLSGQLPSLKKKPRSAKKEDQDSKETNSSVQNSLRSGNQNSRGNVPRGAPQLAQLNNQNHTSTRPGFPSRSRDSDIESLFAGPNIMRVDED